MRGEGWLGFPDFWSGQNLIEMIFNPCGGFRCSPEGIVSEIHSSHLHVGAPGIFSDLLRSVQVLKREWGAESNGKLKHVFIPSKTTTLVPEFAVEDMPLGRTVALVPGFLQWTTWPWAEYSGDDIANGLYEDTKRKAEKRVEWRMLSLQWKTCPWAEHYFIYIYISVCVC